MTVIALKSFSGITPRTPPHLLAPTGAQLAVDCDFAHGELRPLKGNFFLQSMSNSAKGIFTIDGLTFFTWDQPVNAFRSPVVDDASQRIYYSGTNADTLSNQLAGLHVTGVPFMTSTSGGVPSSSWNVGVPQPISAPSSTVIDGTTLPGVTNAQVVINFYYEDGGKQYQLTPGISTLTITPLKKFSIHAPALTAGTTATAGATVKVLALEQTIVSTDPSTGAGTNTITIIQLANAPGIDATINSGTQMTVSGRSYQNLTGYYDANNVRQALQTSASTAASSAGTPATATPQCEVVITDLDKGTTVFRQATTTAGGTAITTFSGSIKVSMEKVPNTTNDYYVNLTYGVAETRAYVFTVVNYAGEESAPSPAVLVDTNILQTVRLLCPVPSSSGYLPINRLRLYRSNSSTAGVTAYQYVGETGFSLGFAASVAAFDTITAAQLGDVLATDNWTQPVDGLTNLTALPNGVFAASKLNAVYFSVPFHPWAWPQEYQVSLPYAVTGMYAMGTSLLVTTTGFPYVISGAHPESFTAARLPMVQAGLTNRSITSIGSAVIYASHDGFVNVTNQAAPLAQSQVYFTREDWRALYAPDLYALQLLTYEGALLLFRTAGTGLMIRTDETANSMTTISQTVNGAFVLPQTDQCYISDAQGRLYQYQGGTALTYQWQSKDFVLDRPANLGCFQIILGANAALGVSVSVISDEGRTTSVTNVTASGVYRLPSGFRARKWSVKLTGQATVKELTLASVPSELQSA